MEVSQVRQNFHPEVEAAINKQINMELYASYVYLGMAYHYDRDDVALHGFHHYFKKSSDEEREHAEKLMKYLNKRGGRIQLADIQVCLAIVEEECGVPQRPDTSVYNSGLEAMQAALSLEKTVNQSLLDLHSLATTHNDAQCCDFIETEYLEEQVKAIKELGDHVTNLKRVGPGLGEYLYDKHSLGGDS
ncbi:FTH1 [Cordylochernes scorpioides]|uniref:Ferritin n=1 Tax=Cordylochernes scorpioides TaxID=51811 RepID=A0ABY6KE25_9ARAC|nr:FTH1 [Cordylochernes scorpioides]UYV67094.1 FTH1 [Cordylochernes scorpioides]